MQKSSDKYWFDFPVVSCTIDVTEKCNLACKYCFAWNKTERTLSKEMADKILEFFFKHCDKSYKRPYEISFWGGEPLLNFDMIVYIIETVKRIYSDFDVIFGGTTNGILLDKEKAVYLGNNRAKFMVSLDGCKEVHDFYRIFPDGSGSFDVVMNNLYTVRNIWPDVHVRFSLSRKLIPKLKESVESLYKEGFKFFMFSPVFEEDWTDEEFQILEEQLYLLADFVKKHSDLHVKHLVDAGSGIWQNYPCGSGRSYISFSVDGYIYPCHRFNKYGDEYKSLREANSIGHVDTGFNCKRQIFLDFPYIRKKQCFGCKVYPYCAGGCYAVHQDITGSVFGKFDMYCKYHRLLFEVATSKFGDGNSVKNGKASCICYNACYMENTESQIINENPNDKVSCMCYNTLYDGNLNAQWRPFYEGK